MSLRWITNVRSSQHRPSKQASFHSFLQNVVKNDYTGAIDLSYHFQIRITLKMTVITVNLSMKMYTFSLIPFAKLCKQFRFIIGLECKLD